MHRAQRAFPIGTHFSDTKPFYWTFAAVKSDPTVTPAIVKGGSNSDRLSCASKLKQTPSPLLFVVHSVPQLTAQVQPRVTLLTSIDTM